MIERGVVGWALRCLQLHCAALAAGGAEGQPLSDYTVEYLTALLMNLSLRQAGKRAAEEAETDVLATLNDMLEVESAQVRLPVRAHAPVARAAR